MSPTLYVIIVSRVNFNKLSRNFVGALRTTTNCRVSFTDFYLVFSRNFRIVFLPHPNTVILPPGGGGDAAYESDGDARRLA